MSKYQFVLVQNDNWFIISENRLLKFKLESLNGVLSDSFYKIQIYQCTWYQAKLKYSYGILSFKRYNVCIFEKNKQF